MSFKLLMVAAALSFTSQAFASTVSPVYSESSYAGAESQCHSDGGHVVGHSMETTTADTTELYLVVCQRPVDDGVTYTIAWSASGFSDADGRCTVDSATTGLPGGHAVGHELKAEPSQPDIYVVVCAK